MSDNSTAAEVSNAQRGKHILAARREGGEHTGLGNDKWKGIGPSSDWFLEFCAWVESLAKCCIRPCLALACSVFFHPLWFLPPCACVMHRQGVWGAAAQALCWLEPLYLSCYSVTAQLQHSSMVLALSPQALAHFLLGHNKNKPIIRDSSFLLFQ